MVQCSKSGARLPRSLHQCAERLVFLAAGLQVGLFYHFALRSREHLPEQYGYFERFPVALTHLFVVLAAVACRQLQPFWLPVFLGTYFLATAIFLVGSELDVPARLLFFYLPAFVWSLQACCVGVEACQARKRNAEQHNKAVIASTAPNSGTDDVEARPHGCTSAASAVNDGERIAYHDQEPHQSSSAIPVDRDDLESVASFGGESSHPLVQ
ncbi:unnamed protein product, partial [Amoebophrya sp. A25]|eukprot:GSA25T00021439001.1